MDNREPLKPYLSESFGYTVHGVEKKSASYADNELLYDIAQSLRILIKEMARPVIMVHPMEGQ